MNKRRKEKVTVKRFHSDTYYILMFVAVFVSVFIAIVFAFYALFEIPNSNDEINQPQELQVGWSYSPDGKYATLTLSREDQLQIRMRQYISATCEQFPETRFCVSSLDQLAQGGKE